MRVGDPVLLREVFRGRVWAARPATLVRDDEDLVVVYLAAGMRWKRPVAADAGSHLRVPADRWALADAIWDTSRMLYLMPPGAAHSIHLWWKAPDWSFGGWYVNLQEPIRRTRLGFDYMDQTLDVVIEPDLSWHWKDERELDDAVETGFLTRQQVGAIRAEGERVIERLERREPPFSDGWERWRPDPAWPTAELPAGWDTLDLD